MSKIRYIVVVVLFLMCYNVLQIYSAPKAKTEVILKHRIDSLEFVCKELLTSQDNISAQLNCFQTSLNNAQQICSSTVSSVSTQIEASNKLLNTWGFILAIVALVISILGLFLGNYIRKRAKTIEILAGQSKETEKSIKETQQSIDTNLKSIYEKLRREETIYILQRLQQVPEDVSNYESILLSRELEIEDYPLLLKAYRRLLKIEQKCKKTKTLQDIDKEIDFTYDSQGLYDDLKSRYRLLFFQHFLCYTIKEELVQQDIVNDFKEFCNYAYRNDIEKSTHDLLTGIIDFIPSKKIEILSEYIKALSTSRYDDCILYEEILETVNPEQLSELWANVTDNNQSRIVFAQSLHEYMNKKEIKNDELLSQATKYISDFNNKSAKKQE